MYQFADCFFLAAEATINLSPVYWVTNAIDLSTARLFQAATALATAAREERYGLLPVKQLEA